MIKGLLDTVDEQALDLLLLGGSPGTRTPNPSIQLGEGSAPITAQAESGRATQSNALSS